MRTFYLQFHVYAIEIMAFQWAYLPIYQCYWSRYMRICYVCICEVRTNFLGPYLSHIRTGTQITRSSDLQLKKLRLFLVCLLRQFSCCHINCDNLWWVECLHFANSCRHVPVPITMATWGQFHQHFTRNFFTDIFGPKRHDAKT